MKEKRNFIIGILMLVFLLIITFQPWGLFSLEKDETGSQGLPQTVMQLNI